MTALIVEAPSRLDIVAELAEKKRWEFDRPDAEQIDLHLPIQGAELYVSVVDLAGYEALHFGFVAKRFFVPKRRHFRMRKMLNSINEHLWVGHFDLHSDTKQVMFRHALLLAGQEAALESCEAVMVFGRTTYERYLTAFVLVAGNACSIESALQSVRFDTQGEA